MAPRRGGHRRSFGERPSAALLSGRRTFWKAARQLLVSPFLRVADLRTAADRPERRNRDTSSRPRRGARDASWGCAVMAVQPGFIDFSRASPEAEIPPNRPLLLEPDKNAERGPIDHHWEPAKCEGNRRRWSSSAFLVAGTALLIAGWVVSSMVGFVADQFHRAIAFGALTLAAFIIASALIAFGAWIEVRSYRALLRVGALHDALSRTGVTAAQVKALCEPWASGLTAQLPDRDVALAALRGAATVGEVKAVLRDRIVPPLRKMADHAKRSGGCRRRGRGRDYPVASAGWSFRRPARSRSDPPDRSNLWVATGAGGHNCFASPGRLDCRCGIRGRDGIKIHHRSDAAKGAPHQSSCRCCSGLDSDLAPPLPPCGRHCRSLLSTAQVTSPAPLKKAIQLSTTTTNAAPGY